MSPQNFTKDLYILIETFIDSRNIIERNQCLIAIMNCIINYEYIYEYLHKYPSLKLVISNKCEEFINDLDACIELKILCARVREITIA